MKNDLSKLRACLLCGHAYMLPTIIIREVQGYAQGDPAQYANDTSCGKCFASHHNYKEDLEKSYRVARQEEFEQRQADYMEWREIQYTKRVAEQEEQKRLAYEYRISRQDPDPDGWGATLRMLAESA